MAGKETLYFGVYRQEELVLLIRIPILGDDRRRVTMLEESFDIETDGKVILWTRWEMPMPRGGWKSFSVTSCFVVEPDAISGHYADVDVRYLPSMDGDLMLAVGGVKVHDSSQLVW